MEILNNIKRSCLISVDNLSTDERGQIIGLSNEPVTNVSVIKSVAGASRSNHYHMTDWHVMYVISGVMDYFFRPVGSEQPLDYIKVETGQLIYTPPNEIHFCSFPEDCWLVCVSKNPRDQESYERDVVRVDVANECLAMLRD